MTLFDFHNGLDIVAIMSDPSKMDRTARTSSTDSVFKDPSYKQKILKLSGTSIESEDFNPEKETRVLVLYTGGTIGMKVHDGGKT